MDDKVFELMEKMYSDLNSKMDSMNSRMDSMNSRMNSMEINMATKQDMVKLEDKMDTNHKVLHDGYKQTYEKLTHMDGKLDRQEEILKGHDLQIKVMRNIK
ncbi:MAG: hypothetical protein GX947_03450 [Tissierellia bacterium]|nr:hypothetical protein [Tissierellia bacterium]